ncbi:MAG: hypothetical protein WDO70_09170 [Alphaproteobacteria bacterium]
MKNSIIATALVAAWAVFGLRPAHADIGPKPTIRIDLPSEISGQAEEGVLLLCKQADCGDAQPLAAVGPQRFSCAAAVCSGMAYGFARYLQLKLKLKDGREMTSDVFEKKAFDAHFKAIYRQDGIAIVEQ